MKAPTHLTRPYKLWFYAKNSNPPILLYRIFRGKDSRVYSTSIKMFGKFDEKRQTAIGYQSEDINKYINDLKAKFFKVQREIGEADLEPSSSLIHDWLNDKPHGRKFILQDMLENITKGEKSQRTLDCRMAHYNVYKTYINENGDEDVLYNVITEDWVKEFEEWCLGRYSKSYYKRFLIELQTLIGRAFHRGEIKINPFKVYKAPKPDKKKLVYLTIKELRKLMSVELNDQRGLSRDLFVFMCFTAMSYAEVQRFGENPEEYIQINIRGEKIINLQRVKSSGRYRKDQIIPLLKQAEEILERQRTHPVVVEQGRGLYGISYKNFRERIKQVCELCDINKNITPHTARKTTGTLLLNLGVPMPVVSKILGHSNQRITENLYTEVLTDTIVDETNKAGELLNKVL